MKEELGFVPRLLRRGGLSIGYLVRNAFLEEVFWRQVFVVLQVLDLG